MLSKKRISVLLCAAVCGLGVVVLLHVEQRLAGDHRPLRRQFVRRFAHAALGIEHITAVSLDRLARDGADQRHRVAGFAQQHALERTQHLHRRLVVREARERQHVVVEERRMRVFARAELDEQFVDVEAAKQRVAR